MPGTTVDKTTLKPFFAYTAATDAIFLSAQEGYALYMEWVRATITYYFESCVSVVLQSVNMKRLHYG